jgi:hypothetical protein
MEGMGGSLGKNGRQGDQRSPERKGEMGSRDIFKLN